MRYLSHSFFMHMKIYIKPVLIVVAILVIDQLIKFWIKTNMYIGEEYTIFGNWFIIHLLRIMEWHSD